MTRQSLPLADKLQMYITAFVFFVTECTVIETVHRGQHPFAFPSFLSSYWFPFVALLPAIAFVLGIRFLYGKNSVHLDPAVRSKITMFFSYVLIFGYVLAGYTINTVEVMTAHW